MSDKDLEIFYPEGKKIKLRGEEFTVKPFVLRERTEVIRIISSIINDATKDKVNLTGKDANAVSMEVIKVAGERLVEIYKMVLKKDVEWLQEILFIEEVSLLKTIMEVNQLPFLLREIQEMFKKTKKTP